MDRNQEYLYEYSDDPEPELSRHSGKKQAFLFLIAFVCSAVALRGVYAANISLGTGAAIEFGQGMSTTIACSGNSQITVTPQSSFSNVSGGGSFKFSGFRVAGIPSGCGGNLLSFNFYSDSSSTPVALYNTNSSTIEISDNGSTFTSANSGLTLSNVSTSAFTVTFTNPVASSASIAKMTVQSTLDSNLAKIGSLLFTSSDALSLASVPAVGTGTFTIEGWFRFTAAPSSNALLVKGSEAVGLYLNSSMDQIHIVRWGSGTGDQTFYLNALSTNTWYHIAVVRDSSMRAQLFINGIKSINSFITDNNNYTGRISDIFSTGAGGKNAGYISNFRMTNTAVYDPTASTITMPSSPLTNVSGTLLLLNTYSDAPTSDSSSNSIVVTPSGSPSWNALDPF